MYSVFERVTPPVGKDPVPKEADPDSQTALKRLATQVRDRIESRLPGRIHDLQVTAIDHDIILRGHCSTFYTKQLAQHVAMGILDYERLINSIEVRIPR